MKYYTVIVLFITLFINQLFAQKITIAHQKEFVKAFDDEGDVPRYKKLGTAPKTGTEVYDDDGTPYSGWDTTKDFGLQLYDVGLSNQTNDYTVERKKINDVVQYGKPESETNGAIAIIIAAPDFDVFTKVFNLFSKIILLH